MQNHPANRNRQIEAVRAAGRDPQVGTWPGDPGFVEGCTTGRVSKCGTLHLTREIQVTLLLLLVANELPIVDVLDKLMEHKLVDDRGRLTPRGKRNALWLLEDARR